MCIRDRLNALQKRDFQDQNRKVAPLKPANDAIIVDTGRLTADGVLENLLNYILKKESTSLELN